jgi:hypothetical protein
VHSDHAVRWSQPVASNTDTSARHTSARQTFCMQLACLGLIGPVIVTDLWIGRLLSTMTGTCTAMIAPGGVSLISARRGI